jgi:ribosomal protein S18 acetylase RimI-like enzyme
MTSTGADRHPTHAATGPVRDHVPVDHDVRRIRADEWRPYRRLRLEALKDSPLAFVDQYADAVTRPDEHWRERAGRAADGPGLGTFVAVEADTFVATATCVVEPEITAYVSAHIVGVYVTPARRGSGLADALMAVVVRWAYDEAGADRVRLFVMESNDRAAAFYRRIGFVPTGATMPYPPDPAYVEHEFVHRPAPASP